MIVPPRSKVDKLPAPVKAWLDNALVEGNFSGYELLETELKARGFDIGKSSLHRYGQEFEDKLAAIRIATQQAKAITEAIPDDAGTMNDVLLRLVQQKAFDTLMKMEEAEGLSLKEIGLLAARTSNASVKQKQWNAEWRERFEAARQAAAEEAAEQARMAGMSPEEAARMGAAVASRIQIYLPDNGR